MARLELWTCVSLRRVCALIACIVVSSLGRAQERLANSVNEFRLIDTSACRDSSLCNLCVLCASVVNN